MVSGVMVNLGVMVRSQSIIYKAVVQMVLFYGNDSWFITDTIMKLLEGFYHQISRRIVGKMACSVG